MRFGDTSQAILSFFGCPGGRNGGSSLNENASNWNCESSSNESGFSAPLGAHSGHFARRGPPGGEIVSRLRTKSLPFGFGTRLRTRAALTPLFGAIWANWPEWVPRGAIELLSFEDDYRFQNGALSFEDDYHFRPSEDAFCQSPDFVVFHRCCLVACAIRL